MPMIFLRTGKAKCQEPAPILVAKPPANCDKDGLLSDLTYKTAHEQSTISDSISVFSPLR